MSEKIKVTVEQAERIKAVGSYDKEGALKCHMNTWGSGLNTCLNDLSIGDFARILYEPNSYEVEQDKFEIWEWVKIKKLFIPFIKNEMSEDAYKLERIFKITGIVPGGKILCPDRYVHNPENLCHATKEEVFWAELGREVGEFREGDVIHTVHNSFFTVSDLNEEVDDFIGKKGVKRKFINGNIIGFYPSESFIKLP